MQFTIGVLGVDLAVNLVLTIGPGRFLLGLVPHPQRANVDSLDNPSRYLTCWYRGRNHCLERGA